MVDFNQIQLSKLEDDIRFDAEYYTAKKLLMEQELKKLPSIQLGDIASITDGQHGYFIIDEDSEIRQITARCIVNGLVDKSSADHLSLVTHNKNLRSSLQSRDILVSTVGTVGEIGIVTDDIPPANIDQNVGRITLIKNHVSPYFLWSFLQSKYGKYQIERFTTGQVQAHLSLTKMKRLKIPIIESQIKVDELVTEFIAQNDRAKKYYFEAQKMLEIELNLDRLNVDKSLGYITHFNEIISNNRTDAEFYDTLYKPLLSRVTSYKSGWFPLKKITARILPTYMPNEAHGKYSYIEIGNVNINDGSVNSSLIPYEKLPANAKILIKGGEILISQVRPTRGAIALLDDKMPLRTICSGAFYVCTSNDIRYREVIWLYLRCVRSVFEKYCGGTSYPTIESNYLDNFPVPLFSSGFAGEIAELIQLSKKAQRKSRILLEEAKASVEQLIEEAIQNETIA